MVTAKIDIPDADYRRARRAAEARGVGFEAFALDAIRRASPPRPGAGERPPPAAVPEGLPAAEFFAGLPVGGGAISDDEWLGEAKRAGGRWADEARDPWA
jgi:hypothetical protein